MPATSDTTGFSYSTPASPDTTDLTGATSSNSQGSLFSATSSGLQTLDAVITNILSDNKKIAFEPYNNQFTLSDGTTGYSALHYAKVIELTGLDALANVNITGTPADNEVLAYDTTSSKWINQTAAEANIVTSANPVITGTISGNAFLDEDDMSSNSAVKVASQQSIKAYVDSQVDAQDLDFQGDAGGALSIDLNTETLTLAGGTGITTTGSNNTMTFAIDNTVAVLTGNQTFTDKNIDADNNTISNLEVDNLKSGVLDTDLGDVSSNDDTLASAKAIKAYVDAHPGDITGVTAGNGLTGGGNSGALTLAVGGTTNRISVSDDAIDIDSNYVGQDSITTLGTITTGTWNGTAIANSNLANSSITITDGTTATARALGETITFNGTTNEVEVGQSGGTVTVGLPNNVTIAGNLTVNGTTTTINTENLSVEDPLIKLAKNNNTDDSLDIGFYGLYDTSGSQDLYAGLFRDANDSGKFKLFKDLQVEPTTIVDTTAGSYATGTLVANLEGNVSGGTINNSSIGATTPSTGAFTTLSATGDVTFKKASDIKLVVHADTGTNPESEIQLMRGANDTWGADGLTDWKIENGYGSSGSDGGNLRIVRGVDGSATTVAEFSSASNNNINLYSSLTVGVNDTGHDVVFYGDTAGKYWMWDASADGVFQRSQLTVGADGTGHDVKFFGTTSGKYMEWDESADQLDVTGSLDVTGNSSFNGDTTFTGGLTVGVDDTGHDVKFFGATSGHYMLWDESLDDLRFSSGVGIDLMNSSGGAGLKLSHVSGSSSIINHTGSFNIFQTVDDGQVYIYNDDGTGSFTKYFQADGSDGEVKLYHAASGSSSLKLATKSTGIEVTGTVIDDGATHDGDVTFTGANYNVVWDKSDDALEFPANAKAKFGSDLEIFSNGSNGVIKDVGSGNLQLAGNVIQLRNSSNNENMLKGNENGSVELYHDGIQKLVTMDDGIDVTGKVAATSLQASGDLTIDTSVLKVDSTNDRVGIGTASPDYLLNISGANTSSADGLAMLGLYDTNTAYNGTNPGGGIVFRSLYQPNSTGTVSLATIQGTKENTTGGNYAGTLRFLTRPHGNTLIERLRISSTGNVGIGTTSPSTKLDVIGDITAKTSDGAILNLQTSDTEVTTGEVLGAIHFQAPDESGGGDATVISAVIQAEASGNFLTNNNETDLVFKVASDEAATERMRLNSTGKLTLTELEVSGDVLLGDAGTGGTDSILKLGAGNDLQIYHDASGGGSGNINNATGHLYITQNADDKNLYLMNDSNDGNTTAYITLDGSVGEVKLNHYNMTKLTTKSTGVDVTGAITATGRIIVDDTTDATSTTDGSLQTDGGLSVAKNAIIGVDLKVGDDLVLNSDAGRIFFGADLEVVLTHVHNDGLRLSNDNQLQFGDSGTYIHQSADGVLDLVADVELELNGAIVDINSSAGNVDINATGGNVTLTGAIGDMTLNNNGPNATGDILLGNFKFDSDQTVGSGQDNYVLTYDNSTGKISLEAAASGGSVAADSLTGTTLASGVTASSLTSVGELTGLTVNGNVLFEGTNYDVAWNKSTNSIKFADGAEAMFGSQNDFAITHSGGSFNTTLKNYTNNLAILNYADDKDVDIYTDNGTGGTAVYFRADGSLGEVQLYHAASGSSSVKLATKSTGVDITGIITTDGATHEGDVTFTGDDYNVVWDKSESAFVFDNYAKTLFGSTSGTNLEIEHNNSSNSIIKHNGTTGDLYIQNKAENKRVYIQADDQNVGGNPVTYIAAEGFSGEARLYHAAAGASAVKLATKSTGIEIQGVSGGTAGTITLNCPENSHGVKIQSPAHSAAQEYTLILPDNQIAADKILKVKSISGSGATAIGQLEFADESSGSGGGVTVQNAGSALSTTATTLNFTGDGVTASGTGATKTINIPGGGSGSGMPTSGGTFTGDVTFTGDNYDMMWDKSTSDLKIFGLGQLQFLDSSSSSSSNMSIFHNTSTDRSYISSSTGEFNISNYDVDQDILIRNDSGIGNGSVSNYIVVSGSTGEVRLAHYSDIKLTTKSGGVEVTGTLTASDNITAYSDERLKSDIKTIDNALDKVMNMRGVSYTKEEEKSIGVIAQEIEKVLPEVVTDGEYKSVAYGNMVGVLIEAIKEQQKQIDELKKLVE